MDALSADPAIICTAKSIPHISVRELFSQKRRSTDGQDKYKTFTIPVFQRRFCWEKQQLQQLLKDVCRHCTRPLLDDESKAVHHLPLSLGRIVVSTTGSKAIVVDGQQRLTSLCLLLAAIRDFITQYLETQQHTADGSQHASLRNLASLCHDTLHPFTSSADISQCLLEPTFFDRASFQACMRSASFPFRRENSVCCRDDGRDCCGDLTESDNSYPGEETHGSGHADHTLLAKKFFDETLTQGSLLHVVWSTSRSHRQSRPGHREELEVSAAFVLSTCTSLVQTVLDKVGVLYFEVNSAQHAQSIFERLAMREALLSSGLRNSTPGVLMRESDLVRNLVTSYGCDEGAQIRMYQKHWAPIEQLSSTRRDPSTKSGDCVDTKRLDACICAFMRDVSPGEPGEKLHQDPGAMCFPLYLRLRGFIRRELTAHGALPSAGGPPTPEMELVVVQLLQSVLAFSETFFGDETESAGREGEAEGQGGTACLCFQRAGTLCTECIVRKYAK